MASWRPAGRFAGDTLLLGDEPGQTSFEIGSKGWRELSSGMVLSAVQVLSLVGGEQRDFIWAATARAHLRSAQLLVDQAAALALGNGTLAAVENRRVEVERIGRELSEMDASRSPGP
jgi:hypothetical protein